MRKKHIEKEWADSRTWFTRRKSVILLQSNTGEDFWQRKSRRTNDLQLFLSVLVLEKKLVVIWKKIFTVYDSKTIANCVDIL